MFNTEVFLSAGLVLLAFAVISWIVSLLQNDVSIVDSLWSLMIMLAGIIYFLNSDTHVSRHYLVLLLLVTWAIRLSAFITWRNHGNEEDYRYQQIRANNEPHFRYKSFYIVFGLQAFLAWLVSMPLLAVMNSSAELIWLDYLAIALWIFGMLFEAVGDQQMARFKADPGNKGKVMDRGLWAFTRHPNYFGECCIWWAFFGFALAAGGWWSIFSPLLMTILLLKVSGVAMLEATIAERRPKYREYSARTNAFIPWFPRPVSKNSSGGSTGA